MPGRQRFWRLSRQTPGANFFSQAPLAPRAPGISNTDHCIFFSIFFFKFCTFDDSSHADKDSTTVSSFVRCHWVPAAMQSPDEFLSELQKNLYVSFYYRKRGSASYIVREVLSVREREREGERYRQTERDGSDVTIVALKLAMNSHFPLPKIRNWRWAYTFPCQKFALFVSPFTLPVSPFTERFTIVALKIAMSSHFLLPKFFSPSLFPLFKMARAARRVIENPRQMIKSYPVLL